MSNQAESALRRDGDTLVVEIAGSWLLDDSPALAASDVERALGERPERVRFDATSLERWGSRLVSFAERVTRLASGRGIIVDWGSMPAGVRRLLALAQAPVAVPPSTSSTPHGLWARVDRAVRNSAQRAHRIAELIGEAAQSFVRLLAGRAHFRARDFWAHVHQAGAQALPIVSLVSVLVGLILAFVASVQLEAFGASVYVADLVGIAIVRDIGAIMAAIVLAGRTGAAYAAELGTMRVTEETDALTTLGISVVDLLVLPRLLALTLMLPLLTVYADFMGTLGGAVVGITLMDLHPWAYYEETIDAVTGAHLWGGIVKAAVYGALVAIAGCFEGLQCARTAASVGKATTAAVVQGIVLIIVACGAFAVVFHVLGI